MQLVRSRGPRGRRRVLTRLAVPTLGSIFFLLAAVTSAPAQTFDRVREAGAIRLGYLENARPFSYRDESGKPSGYAVALCGKIADAVQQELGLPQLRREFALVDFGDAFDAVQQGRIDLLCGASTATLARREKVSFSIPIFPGGVGALMRKDAPERMRNILAGKPEPYRPRWRASLGQILAKRTFAVVTGTTTEAWLKSKIEEFNIIATIKPESDFAVGVQDVVARRADVLFADRAILLEAVKRNASGEDLLVLERRFTYEPLALALARRDEDFRLLVDRTLSQLYGSGITEIYAPFFGAPSEEAQQFFRMSALPE